MIVLAISGPLFKHSHVLKMSLVARKVPPRAWTFKVSKLIISCHNLSSARLSEADGLKWEHATDRRGDVECLYRSALKTFLRVSYLEVYR